MSSEAGDIPVGALPNDKRRARKTLTQRLRRQRLAKGMHTAIVVLSQGQVKALCDRGYLIEFKQKADLSEAIETFLMDLLA